MVWTIRYLDYNDAYTGKSTTHPSDMLAASLAAQQNTPMGAWEGGYLRPSAGL